MDYPFGYSQGIVVVAFAAVGGLNLVDGRNAQLVFLVSAGCHSRGIRCWHKSIGIVPVNEPLHLPAALIGFIPFAEFIFIAFVQQPHVVGQPVVRLDEPPVEINE